MGTRLRAFPDSLFGRRIGSFVGWFAGSFAGSLAGSFGGHFGIPGNDRVAANWEP